MSSGYESETVASETTVEEMSKIIAADFRLDDEETGGELAAWVIVAMVGVRCPDPACGERHLVPMTRSSVSCDLATARVLSETTTALIDGAARAGGHLRYGDDEENDG